MAAMPEVVPREWTQIDLTSRRGVWGQRFTAGLLVAAGAIGFVVGFPALAWGWWPLALLAFSCLLMVVLGIGLWINASLNGRETVTLRDSGTRADAPVVGAFETTDEAVRYQLRLELPAVGGDADGERQYVVHSCGDHRCVAAGRAVPNAALPILIDPAKRTWGVIHGSNAS